jgi:ketosteroid isomerase-like protein
MDAMERNHFMSRQQNVSDADAVAIARVRDTWLKAIHADDLDGLLESLTDDAQVYPPHEAPLIGKSGSAQWHQARIGQFKTQLEMSGDELAGAGDLVFEQFWFRIVLTPRAGGSAISDTGHCVWLWQRESGSWKLSRAIWNSDQPIAATV